ncbi:unnamed protein product [Allacma fusca]|uniref:Uncharacterized protein n=1 Tax=Allacma fusca TaxID=39272 RepID=A0A8J2LGJ0_9HEXA|nr:unnamed protein product [Allacma fusca]
MIPYSYSYPYDSDMRRPQAASPYTRHDQIIIRARQAEARVLQFKPHVPLYLFALKDQHRTDRALVSHFIRGLHASSGILRGLIDPTFELDVAPKKTVDSCLFG